MLFAHVSPQEQETLLEELKQASDATWYRRLKIIPRSSKRTTGPELARLFALCPDPVRREIKRYHAGGLPGLKRQARGGAPQKIPLTTAEWEELLPQRPSQFDRLQTGARNWTHELRIAYFQHEYGVSVVPSTISACLNRQKIRWNRGKLKVTSPDPL
jgi:transposase